MLWPSRHRVPESLYLFFKGTKKPQAAEVGEHTDEVVIVSQTGLDLIL